MREGFTDFTHKAVKYWIKLNYTIVLWKATQLEDLEHADNIGLLDHR
jgi:hypothetical protein